MSNGSRLRGSVSSKSHLVSAQRTRAPAKSCIVEPRAAQPPSSAKKGKRRRRAREMQKKGPTQPSGRPEKLMPPGSGGHLWRPPSASKDTLLKEQSSTTPHQVGLMPPQRASQLFKLVSQAEACSDVPGPITDPSTIRHFGENKTSVIGQRCQVQSDRTQGE